MFSFLKKEDPFLRYVKHRPRAHEIRKLFKIVVIDDDEKSFPTKQLQDDGYTIEHWEKIEAHKLERLERAEFDIIVLDIKGIADSSISSNEGIGILNRIKKVNPEQLVVAFSGQTWETAQLPFFKLADDVLDKPVTHVKCKDLLDKLIEENLTIEHQWNVLHTFLKKSDVPEKDIKKLRQYIGTCLSKRRSPDQDELRKKFFDSVSNTEICLRLIKTIIQLATIAGGGNP